MKKSFRYDFLHGTHGLNQEYIYLTKYLDI